MSTTTPVQNIFHKPYSQRIHHTYLNTYNEDGSITRNIARYMDKDFNNITRLYGQDVIINGCDIDSVSKNGNVLQIVINSGELVTDDCYVDIDDQVTLTYENLHVLSDSGRIAIMSDFENTDTLLKNKIRFRLIYVDSDNNPIDTFDRNRNRILLGLVNFTNSGGSLSSVELDSDTSTFNIYGTWSHDLESEFTETGATSVFLDNLYLAATNYTFSYQCYDCDLSNDGFLRFQGSTNTVDAVGTLTGDSSWVTQSGTVTIPTKDNYNLVIHNNDTAELKDFQITGDFSFDVQPKGKFEVSLDGGFI